MSILRVMIFLPLPEFGMLTLLLRLWLTNLGLWIVFFVFVRGNGSVLYIGVN